MQPQQRLQFKILPKPKKNFASHELKNQTFVKFDKQIHAHTQNYVSPKTDFITVLKNRNFSHNIIVFGVTATAS